MNILITGSEGFIARHLIKELAKTKHHLILGDIKNGFDVCKGIVIDEDVDLIVHCAAQTSTKQSIENPERDFLTNAYGTMEVLQFAAKESTPVIYLSSRKAVENDEGQRSPYGLSKYVGELLCKEWSVTYGVPVIINRLGNIYGDDQHGSPEAFWLAWFIEAKKKNLPVTVYGFNGEQSRDMLHIDDLVRLLMMQIEDFDRFAGNEETNKLYFEVGGGKDTEVSLNEAIKYLGLTDVTYTEELPGDKKRLVTDQEDLLWLYVICGWKPEIGWKEGIDRILAQ